MNRTLAHATPLPVNADFQSGYADDAEAVGANVARCVAPYGCPAQSREPRVTSLPGRGLSEPVREVHRSRRTTGPGGSRVDR